jgi:error-prone DNA polymerase
MSAAMLSIRGVVQREGEVIHVVTTRMEDLTPLLHSVGGRDFPHRTGPADGAKNAGPDPREGLGRKARNLFEPVFDVGRDEAKIPLKSRNFH